MKRLLPILLFVAVTAADAQRGGMGRGTMGGGPGGGRGPGFGMTGVRPGGAGFTRGIPATHRSHFTAPSVWGGGFRGGVGLGWGGWGWGGWGLGWGLGWGNYGCPYSYPCSSYVSSPYVGGYWPGYSDAAPIQYSPSYAAPPVTVVYPPAPVERANPVMREYDASGQEIRAQPSANASPIYLFAFRDQAIRAASSYRVEGQTLHYVTLQHEEKQAPLDTLDRALTLQLNRERRVPIQLP
jgi:hypothetical protein